MCVVCVCVHFFFVPVMDSFSIHYCHLSIKSSNINVVSDSVLNSDILMFPSFEGIFLKKNFVNINNTDE